MITLESILLINNYLILSKGKTNSRVIRKYLTQKISNLIRRRSNRGTI